MAGHLYNRTLAVSAARGEEVLVVFFTVWLAVSLKETTGAEFNPACGTRKVFWVPHLTQSCDHLHGQKNIDSKFVRDGDKFVNSENSPVICREQDIIITNLLSVASTFPAIHLPQEAQWPLAAVRTPIFSMSELREPSKSSIASTLLDTLFDSGGCGFLSSSWLPLSLSLVSSVFLSFTDLRATGGGLDVGTGSETYKINHMWSISKHDVFNWFSRHELGALICLYCPLLVLLIMCIGSKMQVVDAWKCHLMSTSCFPHLQTES